MAAKTCAICGKPSGYLPLCNACFKLRDEGKVIKCEKCGEWNSIEVPCKCTAIKYTVLPTEGFDKCVSCGIATIGYAFCRECWQKYTIEEMLKILNNSTTNNNKNVNQNKLSNKNIESKCVICGEDSGKYKLCKDCWEDKEDNAINDKRRNKDEIKDDYFNHKSYLYSLKNPKFLYYGMIRLIAIAEELVSFHRDSYLINLVYTDIEKLNEKKFNDTQTTIPEDKTSLKDFDSEIVFTEKEEWDFRKIYPANYFCKDGHYVRSPSEKILDDWLYENKIFHCYEKKIQFGEAANECIISDFYLPENNIYIELWGNIDEKYAKRKAKKIEIYKNLTKELLEVENWELHDVETIMERNIIKYKIKNHKDSK